MLSFLLFIHFLLVVIIIGLILIQKQDSDGALGSGRSAAGGLFSVRGQATALSKTTAIVMGIIVINCIIMGRLSKTKSTSPSLLDQVAAESRSNASAKKSTNEPSTGNDNLEQTKTKKAKADDSADKTVPSSKPNMLPTKSAKSPSK